MAEFSRQSLSEAITAVRAARDACARSAAALKEHNALRLGIKLDEIAAAQDRQLAELLREDAKLQYRAGAIPPASSESPAG